MIRLPKRFKRLRRLHRLRGRTAGSAVVAVAVVWTVTACAVQVPPPRSEMNWTVPDPLPSSAPAVELQGTPRGAARREWWVDLSLPAPAAHPAVGSVERAERAVALEAQQAQVMNALRLLGATELGRVRGVRNALAVSLPNAQLTAAAAIPGVLRLRPLQHRNRPHLEPVPAANQGSHGTR